MDRLEWSDLDDMICRQLWVDVVLHYIESGWTNEGAIAGMADKMVDAYKSKFTQEKE